MKNTISFSLLACGLLAWCIIGCSSLDRVLYREKVTIDPPRIIGTNIVSKPDITNAITGEITPGGFESRVVYSEPVTNRSLADNPLIKTAIDSSGFLPFPFAGTAAAALAWAYAFYRSVRNKKLAAGIAQSVESAREWLKSTPEGQATDAKILEILQRDQRNAGILPEVKKLLDQYVH